jgi:hypothetical protein
MKCSLLIIYLLSLGFLHTNYPIASIAKDRHAIVSKQLNQLQTECYHQPPPVFRSECPVQGNAKSARVQQLNILKNRINVPGGKDFDHSITMSALLKNGDDRNRWSVQRAAKIIAYVADVKPGGIETANCKAKNKDDRDTHIELSLQPMSYEKNQRVIVEITPRMRRIMAAKGVNWSTSSIRSNYLGRWVEVQGWMLLDIEHLNMAEHTNPGNTKNWRATAWEIHPITSIAIAATH